MEEAMLLALVFLVAFCGFFLAANKKFRRYPPGPRCLPLLGYVPSFWKEIHMDLVDVAEKYGPIAYFNIGDKNFLLLSEYRLIKRALKEEVFAGRPSFEALDVRLGGRKTGYVFVDGESFHEKQRFLLRHLKEFGFGNRSMEDVIADEVDHMVTFFKEHVGKPVDLHHRFHLGIVNCFWCLVAGKRFDQNDPKMMELFSRFHEFLLGGIPMLAGFTLYRVAKWAPNFFKLDSCTKFFAIAEEVFKAEVEEHKRILKQDEPRDLIDVWLKESSSTGNQTRINEADLVSVLVDLFIAASDTSSTVLAFAFLYLAHNPQVQRDVHEEVERVVGRDRTPTFQDRTMMPFVEATLLEVLRFASISPVAIPHALMGDIELEGYFIPKDTVVLPNLNFAHHDARHWDKPHEFLPQRFLSPEGKVRKNPCLMPFSTGKRSCPGELLANKELFLFFTALVQKFSFHFEEDVPKPSLQSRFAFVFSLPQPFRLIARERHL